MSSSRYAVSRRGRSLFFINDLRDAFLLVTGRSIFGTTGFFCEDASDLIPQHWTAILGGAPNYVPIDPEVGVNQEYCGRQ
jgi:hypothetical protein